MGTSSDIQPDGKDNLPVDAQLTSYLSYHNSLPSIIDNLQKDKRQQAEQIHQLNGENARLKAQNANLDHEVKRLSGEMTSLSVRNSSLDQDVKRLTGENTNLSAQNNNLHQDVKRLTGENTKLNGDNAGLNTQNSSLAHDMQQFQMQHSEKIAQLNDEKAKYNHQATALSQEVTKLQSQLTGMDKNLEDAQRELVSKISISDAVNKELASVTAELSACKVLVARLENDKAELERWKAHEKDEQFKGMNAVQVNHRETLVGLVAKSNLLDEKLNNFMEIFQKGSSVAVCHALQAVNPAYDGIETPPEGQVQGQILDTIENGPGNGEQAVGGKPVESIAAQVASDLVLQPGLMDDTIMDDTFASIPEVVAPDTGNVTVSVAADTKLEDSSLAPVTPQPNAKAVESVAVSTEPKTTAKRKGRPPGKGKQSAAAAKKAEQSRDGGAVGADIEEPAAKKSKTVAARRSVRGKANT